VTPSPYLTAALRYGRRGWAVFPLRAKKPLAGTRGYLDATADAKAVGRLFRAHPDADGVGLATGRASGVVILDVDGPEGHAALAALCGGKIPDAPMVRTSGDKFHVYFRYPSDRKVGRWIGFRPTLDVLGDRGYAAVPPTVHPETGKPYEWLEEGRLPDLPGAIREANRKPDDASSDDERGVFRLPEVIPEGERDDTLFRYACSLRSRGIEERQILDELQAANATRCRPPLDETQLTKLARQAARYPAGMEDALRRLNKTYAVVQIGSDVVILQQRDDGDAAFLKSADFRLLVRNAGVFERGARGRMKRTSLADAWLDWPERRAYARVVFKPGVTDPPPGEFNLWRGWAVAPNPRGRCDRFLAHLREVVCGGNAEHYEWLLDWLANVVQVRFSKQAAGVAVALQGEQGAGKSIVGAIMKRLLGRSLVVAEKPEHVTGRFNGHLALCLLLQAEEAFWAGDRRGEAVLKHLVTGETLMIERKGVDSVEMPNFARLLVTSNADWVWPTDVGDRRLVIFKVKGTYRNNKAYFARLLGELEERDGYGRLLDMLLSREIDAVRLLAPPRTKALEEQAIHSLTAEEEWLLDLLTSGYLPGGVVDAAGNAHVRTGELYEAYRTRRPKYPKSEKAFGLFLRKHLPRAKGIEPQCERRFTNAEWERKQSQRRVLQPLAACRARYSRRGRAAPQTWGAPKRWKIRKKYPGSSGSS
jgi:hypothetical protein